MKAIFIGHINLVVNCIAITKQRLHYVLDYVVQTIMENLNCKKETIKDVLAVTER